MRNGERSDVGSTIIIFFHALCETNRGLKTNKNHYILTSFHTWLIQVLGNINSDLIINSWLRKIYKYKSPAIDTHTQESSEQGPWGSINDHPFFMAPTSAAL